MPDLAESVPRHLDYHVCTPAPRTSAASVLLCHDSQDVKIALSGEEMRGDYSLSPLEHLSTCHADDGGTLMNS